ncbi:MAG TPA: hypothetical protein VIK74_11450 [Parasegetibacter sp.]|jgi:hypothetical protein
MNQQLQFESLPPSSLEKILQSLESDKAEIEAKIISLMNDRDSLNSNIKRLREAIVEAGQAIQTTPFLSRAAYGYRTDMTWQEKILCIIEKAGKPLKAGEIWKTMLKLEPSLHPSKRTAVDSYLSRLVDSEKLIKKKVEKSPAIYGLKEYFSEN